MGPIPSISSSWTVSYPQLAPESHVRGHTKNLTWQHLKSRESSLYSLQHNQDTDSTVPLSSTSGARKHENKNLNRSTAQNPSDAKTEI